MENLKSQLLNSPARYLWERIGIFSHHGIDLPVSALRTKKSCGIGEFFDLLPIIDWCHEIKLDVLMLLPLNECTTDPSPYNSISSRALHPIYLSLEELPYLQSYPKVKGKLAAFRYLNETPRIQYHEVLQKKMVWLREYFEAVKESFLANPDFENFKESHHWLKPYALFKVLKHKMEQAPWTTWPKELLSPSKGEYDQLIEDNQDDIIFHIALQFLCYEQMKCVKNYSLAKQVFLKGDIPILINPDSVDVWAEPHLFDLTKAAGAPPDAYSSEGQYWGCPLFNWNAMRKYAENYEWWKERLDFAGHFYDLFRIDHIVGFFRIWGIPHNHSPKAGSYIPADPSEWIPQGQEILQFLHHNSNMLPIGEDLGTVPREIKHCLAKLGIPGTKIIRWERKEDKKRSFIPYDEYPRLSMTSVSTHDTEPLALWWQVQKDEAKAFAEFKGWSYSPTLSFDQHREILRDSHQTPSLFHINLLQDYLSLFPELVWENLKDEQINIPGTTSPFNWTYRFRPSVEEIVSHEGLKKTMKELIRD
ncbi:4-alpha-glucanotransferase [Simkania negevensis]|uniref:4-alpha-glucanotransferase n=1 Tax=Simkania negevensis (strain ATCC VR-1471 / DSM 27360 / Z) TaxID=331113 RepID=F8L9V9_SIMNZ|nr:4-alpha-glucanotransferase [Simkania negevensis]CCB89665.1 4-alpha-glucanotransferase [Simkania negevensis Z]